MALDQYRHEPYNPFAPTFLSGSTDDETTIPPLAPPEPYQFAPEEKSPMESIGSQLLGNVVTKEVNSAFGLGDDGKKKENVGLSYGQSKGSPHKDITDGAKGGIAGMIPLIIAATALPKIFRQ